MDLKTLEQDLFVAVQDALNKYAPGLHLSVAPIRSAVTELATSIFAGAEAALKSNVITTTAAGIGATLGTAAGAAIGTAIGGPLGTALGSAAGAALGTIVGTTLGAAFTSIAEQFVAAEGK